jgi:hypothetical protein
MFIHENNNRNKLVKFLQRILNPPIIQNISRPKDIPPIVPDCGWNHGEPPKNNKASM